MVGKRGSHRIHRSSVENGHIKKVGKKVTIIPSKRKAKSGSLSNGKVATGKGLPLLSILDEKLQLKEKLEKVIIKEEQSFTFYKIIPHTSNLNSTSRKLVTSLYELFNFTYKRYPWDREKWWKCWKRDNLYVTVKSNPVIWWGIKLKAHSKELDTGEKELLHRVELSLAIPTEFKTAFETKFSVHEQWRKATLEEVEEKTFHIPTDNTTYYSMKYARNDMFSLSFDYKQQETPIRDIFSVVSELTDGEEVNVLIEAESLKRKKWQSLVNYAWGVWEKGKVPSRQGFSPAMVVYDVTSVFSIVLMEAKYFVDTIMYGISSSFFNDKDGKPTRETSIWKNPEREALLVNGDLSKETKRKRNLPTFRTNLMYTVTSENEIRSSMIARSTENGLNTLKGDNYFIPVKINMNSSNKLEIIDFNRLKAPRLHRNIMSTDELGKLMQLPTSQLQRDFEQEMDSNKRVEIELDKELLQDRGIWAGTATNRGETYNIHIQRDNLDLGSTARAIIGSPRMGKDQHVINLVVEGKRKHNMGAIVLDVINEQNGHRGMADAIRDHLNEEDVIDINFLDYDNPVSLGLESITKVIENKRIAGDRMADELCDFLLQDGDEDKLQTADHLREASKLANGDILTIKHIFTSKKVRNDLMKEKKDMFDMDIWEMYNEMSDGRQQSIYTPIMRRIGQILNSEILKPIFCQEGDSPLNLYEEVKKGKVILFRMKTGVMSQRVTEILCHWIILVSYLIKMGQPVDKSENGGTYLVLNEPHQYLTDGIVNMLSRILAEGPKYRFIPLFIFHNFSQFSDYNHFVKLLKSSSLNWHIFKNTNEDVYKELFGGYLSRTFDTPLQAFESTKKFQYIGVWLDSYGNYYDPFVADALKMVSDRYETKDNSHLTKNHSRKYGRPIQEVLDSIRRRNKDAIDVPPDTKRKQKG